MVGGISNPIMPKPLTNQAGSTVDYTGRDDKKFRPHSGRKGVKDVRQWILNKKERRRKQGKETRPDTKYTGRKRPDKF